MSFCPFLLELGVVPLYTLPLSRVSRTKNCLILYRYLRNLTKTNYYALILTKLAHKT